MPTATAIGVAESTAMLLHWKLSAQGTLTTTIRIPVSSSFFFFLIFCSVLGQHTERAHACCSLLQSFHGHLETLLYRYVARKGDGKNIASLDNGDYADYYIKVNSSGTYNVTYRSAADPNWSSGGQLELSLLDPETGNYNSIQNMILPTTSGWQSWESTSKPLTL